ncbi:hypothetical protein ABBQ32_005136 [Trebouxia sp. C0010 RCD-2024]
MAVGMPTAASVGGVAMILTPRARGLGAVVVVMLVLEAVVVVVVGFTSPQRS